MSKASTRVRKSRASGRRAHKPVHARGNGKRDTDRHSRAIEIVLAAFAHDIRTPLTGILALSELLATSGLELRERRWVAAIKGAAAHIAELTTLMIEGARARVAPMAVTQDIFHPEFFGCARGFPGGARRGEKSHLRDGDRHGLAGACARRRDTAPHCA